MKAVRLVTSAPQPVLVEEEMRRPEPQPGELVVRVRAVAVTPTKVRWHTASHTTNGSPRNAAVLGHEFSGEIAECGEGVRDFAVGQDLYGTNDWFAEGALAEYCVTRPEWTANKPQGLSHEEAASVPINALTAWQEAIGAWPASASGTRAHPWRGRSREKVDYPPGGESTVHHRGGSVLAYVLTGAIRSQNSETGAARTYKTGDTFFEPAGSDHLISENASATEPASLFGDPHRQRRSSPDEAR